MAKDSGLTLRHSQEEPYPHGSKLQRELNDSLPLRVRVHDSRCQMHKTAQVQALVSSNRGWQKSRKSEATGWLDTSGLERAAGSGRDRLWQGEPPSRSH